MRGKHRKAMLCIACLTILGLACGTWLIKFSPVSAAPVTIPDSVDVHFPDRSYSTLEYTIRTTRDTEEDAEIHYSIDEIATDPYARFFYIYVDTVKVLETTISGDKSGIVVANALKTLGTHTIKVEIYFGAYGDGCYELEYLKLDEFSWDQNMAKYAVFFWQEFDKNNPTTSGVISANRIDRYHDRMEDLGYTIYDHMNPTNWVGDMNTLDALEDEDSIIFIYIAGHGSSNTGEGWSRVRVHPSNYYINSDDLRDEIDDLESKRIMVMVDSCQNGYFKDDLDKDGVSVITSTDYTHSMYFEWDVFLWWGWAEPEFSNYFFDKAGLNYSGEGRDYDERDAFGYAKVEVESEYEQYPLNNYEAWHSFFGP